MIENILEDFNKHILNSNKIHKTFEVIVLKIHFFIRFTRKKASVSADYPNNFFLWLRQCKREKTIVIDF